MSRDVAKIDPASASGGEPLLATKLCIPPGRPNLVTRPGLVERLEDVLRLGHKLTLVCAAAARSWARGAGGGRGGAGKKHSVGMEWAAAALVAAGVAARLSTGPLAARRDRGAVLA